MNAIEQTWGENDVKNHGNDPVTTSDNNIPHENSEELQNSSISHASGEDDVDRNKNVTPAPTSFRQKVINFCLEYEFLLLVACAILLALAYPPLGAEYLAPDITANWLAVCFIFFLSGLELKTKELTNAFMNIWFNVLVQVFNFGVVSVIVWGASRGLEYADIISSNLADGMIIGACVPMTINMVQVMTKSAGGDEAASIFNSAFGNLIGVFLSPVLILGYLGVTGDVDLVEVFYKLALRVVVPVLVGQLLQKTSRTAVEFVQKHKKLSKRVQLYCLIFIVYTVFCLTFAEDNDRRIGDIFIMIAFQFLLLASVMALAWQVLRFTFPNQPKLRVMGLFGCTHKTVAMGVPLINAIYEGNPAVGLYTLPLLVWHPLQLILGSILAPRLLAFVEREEKRLGTRSESVDVKKDEAAIEEGQVDAVGDSNLNNVSAESIGVGRISFSESNQ